MCRACPESLRVATASDTEYDTALRTSRRIKIQEFITFHDLAVSKHRPKPNKGFSHLDTAPYCESECGTTVATGIPIDRTHKAAVVYQRTTRRGTSSTSSMTLMTSVGRAALIDRLRMLTGRQIMFGKNPTGVSQIVSHRIGTYHSPINWSADHITIYIPY